jgi:hypothetical protein
VAQPVYCTREDVKGALDSKTTARDDTQVDRAIRTGARNAEGLLHRRFYPQVATRFFDWPNDQYARPWRLWLDDNELIAVTSLTTGGQPIAPSDFFLEPANSGPPFRSIELDLDSNAAFGGGDTHQRDIAIEGLWGYRNDETQVGQLTADLGLTGSAGIQLDATVGVGAILRIDQERLIVVAKSMVDTGQDLAGPGLATSDADVTVPVTTGTAFDVDEIILLGAERMLVVDVAGNNLIVKRAWDGSVLAAHSTGADVYGLTGYTVERGQLGTTAATHTNGTAIWRWEPPATLRSLNIAEAINTIQQEQSAYARTVGSGDNERETAGRGLRQLRDEAYTELGRKARSRAI